MDRLTNGNTVVVTPTHSADCNTYQFHCEDCDCEVMDCGFIRDALNRLCEYENTGLSPEEVQKISDETSEMCIMDKECFRRIMKYIKAEAEGRLIVLPVKVGDTVYVIKNVVSRGYPDPIITKNIFEEHFSYSHLEYLQAVYLSYEAAEAALKEAQG